MLTTLDDTLWHQLPTTFDHVGTSDPRFYDRFWFACYERGGAAAPQIPLGAGPYHHRTPPAGACGGIAVGGGQWQVRGVATGATRESAEAAAIGSCDAKGSGNCSVPGSLPAKCM